MDQYKMYSLHISFPLYQNPCHRNAAIFKSCVSSVLDSINKIYNVGVPVSVSFIDESMAGGYYNQVVDLVRSFNPLYQYRILEYSKCNYSTFANIDGSNNFSNNLTEIERFNGYDGSFARDCNMVINNDVGIDLDTIEKLYSIINDNDYIGAVSPISVYPGSERLIQFLTGMIYYCGPYLYTAHSSSKLSIDYVVNDATGIISSPFLSAFCLMYRNGIIKWDEIFVMDFEDVDFGLRLWDAGYASVSLLDTVVTHYEEMSRKDMPSEVDNPTYLRSKWSPRDLERVGMKMHKIKQEHGI